MYRHWTTQKTGGQVGRHAVGAMPYAPHMWRCLLVGIALGGCYEHGRSPGGDAGRDGAIVVPPDAQRPRNDPGPGPFMQPFDATFVTPAGTFDAHVLFAQAVWGDCNPPFWELKFTSPESGIDASVTLHVSLPPYSGVEVSGRMMAGASYLSSEPLVSHSTQNATFDAIRIDYPADGAPRITGHFVDTDPAWAIDVNLDVLGISTGCI